jgi:peptidoglycan hydrolase-like protein with peptidoglycan-binding domain
VSKKPAARRGRRRRVEDEEAEGSGLLARAIDRTFENPAMSGGLLVMALAATAIVSNALFLQTGRHPDPLFMTRAAPSPEAAPRQTPKPEASATLAAPVAARRQVVLEQPPLPRLAPRHEPAAVAPPAADPLAELTTASLPPTSTPEPPAAVPEPATAASAEADLVTEIQRELARIGLYNGAIDGLPGARTEAAIRAFETAAGIAVTGAPGPALLAALKQPLPPRETQSIAVGSTEAAELNRRERERAASIAAEERRQEEGRVRETYAVVQGALNRIGYGPLPVDGTAGPETLDAIRRFELDNGMPVTGIAGDALVARLFAIGAIKPG